ncbi:unnamed protein product (macronuclear) [Paramecium tetraurelia]|uniref:MIF4G-like type 2 domain-containing protein n=1 Tax=Paramecium tetraurelia TaxID=5888 RepID=A0CRM1_PARTE|nr:uncharacterized protein GSPATT00009753001 [Paramecium tetraurelia]CAK73438.1 unnamed protein product [Paramecium tetraurelia]|eukprot:XP_001440835.1 hypothetical protein (macronuclear) [Paramecium tetraurelia strain d4-2]
MLQISHQIPPEINRIRQLICKAGDDGADTFKKDLQKIVDVLGEYYQQNKQEVKDAMIQSFIQCAKLLPLKAGIYATILALLSTKQTTQSLTDQIILGLLEHLPQIAQEETPILGQTILKFLSELMNVGLLNTVSFVECLYDLEGGAENEQSPFYLQILLTTLPHAMIKAMEKNQIEFKNIIQNVEVLMTKRKTEDRLFHLWQSIRNFLNNQEKDAHTQIFQQFLKTSYPRPYLLFPDEMTQVRQLRRGFKIPIVKRTQIWRPQQILVLNDEIRSQNSNKTDVQIEITRQWIYETIDLFKTNRQQIVFQFQLYQNCIKMSPTQEVQFRQTLIFTLLNMAIEVVPRKDQLSSAFYSGLLTHLSQRNSDSIKEWNETIEQFIDQIPQNNILIVEQLSDCLSHYFCNSNFKLNWDKYFGKYNPDETDSFNNYLVIMIFRKLFLLVSVEKITDLVPKNIIDWYNQLPDITKPLDIEQHSLAEKINSYLQQKLNGVDMLEQLKQITNPNPDAVIQTFIECLFQCISKSITHLNVLSKRYLSFLLQPNIIKPEKLGEIMLNTIFRMWNHSVFHLKVYLKEFLNLEVISNLQVVNWLNDLIKQKPEVFKIYNVLIAINDVFRKQTKLDQVQDCTYESVKEINTILTKMIDQEQDVVIQSSLENIQLQILIAFKQTNGTQLEKLLKEIKSNNVKQIVMSF